MKSLNFKKLLFTILSLAFAHRIFAIDLRPDNASVQCGGGMGIVSAGTGWRYGCCQRWETEMFLGFIPKYDSNSAKAAIALKENFIPWQIRLNDSFSLEPLTASIYFTTVLSKRFWVRQPDWYPSGYYRLSTKIRANIAIGQRIGWNLPGGSPFRRISAYYEIGTCDIYALCAAGNKEIRPRDWLQLCLGLRLTFRH